MEGKEARFGIVNSALWATATTAASNGSVNSMHDSYTPLGGLVPMWLMQLGEVIFGGVGSGLYGMLVFAIVAVFVAGLMIGRTPEYLGKKIEAYEIKMSAIAVLIPLIMVLGGTAVAVMLEAGRAGVANPGAHAFSEILYAFSSAGNNNGSAFAGLSANTPFYNTALGIAMWFSRFWVMIPVLALAGSLAAKKKVPAGLGTLPTHTPLFVFFLIGVVVIVGALTFIPALALGPDRRAARAAWRQVAPRRPGQHNPGAKANMSTQTATAIQIPQRSLVTGSIVRQALIESFVKLLPHHQWKNPVMFVVYVGSILTTILYFQALAGQGEAPAGFILAITVWLWFTVLFANFAEAMAEGRSKAQAATLRSAKQRYRGEEAGSAAQGRQAVVCPSADLRKGDVVLVEAGDFIPPTAR